MRQIILVLTLALLVGCGTRTVYEEKKVPVYRVPEPPKIERPVLPIHELDIQWTSPDTLANNVGEIAQAMVVSLRLTMNWGEANEKIVEAYRRMHERDFTVNPLTFAAAAPSGENAEDIEFNVEGDYATLEEFAKSEFRTINNKYEEDKNQILEEYHASEPD